MKNSRFLPTASGRGRRFTVPSLDVKEEAETRGSEFDSSKCRDHREEGSRRGATSVAVSCYDEDRWHGTSLDRCNPKRTLCSSFLDFSVSVSVANRKKIRP